MAGKIRNNICKAIRAVPGIQEAPNMEGFKSKPEDFQLKPLPAHSFVSQSQEFMWLEQVASESLQGHCAL